MRLTVIGSGYVGLVIGAGFADSGNLVTCMDIDRERIALLRCGLMPIFEPGLQELIAKNVERSRLRFSTDTKTSMAGADVVFIAVDTPPNADGSASLDRVMSAVDASLDALTGPAVFVVKSTVPVGTGDRIAEIANRRAPFKVTVVSNPEFLKEGDALNDFMRPARIIIGLDDPSCRDMLEDLYSSFLRTNNRMLFMDRRSAELTKYAANAMLATRISFMNELSHLATAVDADIEDVRLGLGADPRIGNKFLFAGAGFGGSCFPKDIRCLLKTAFDYDVRLGVVDAVQAANARQKMFLGHMVRTYFGEKIRGLRIAVWGLAFKPRTDDIRESPAIDLIQMLRSSGAIVSAYDPEAIPNAQRSIGDEIEYATDMYAAAENADALVLVTEWSCFRLPDLVRLGSCMRQRVLFDGRNIWSPDQARLHGFAYYGVGRRRGQATSDR